ncbi:hypothetical protein LFM09_39580 [Lentzea alba]|uniref:hypothetical protein n=1 Tax=Lentzea alba TaxID=2714351 RepID=UPI0039BF9157
MLTRALVVLAVLLTGCAPEVEDRYTNKLVSCSVNLPQDWRDALAANEVKAGAEKSVDVVAASPDGRATVLRTWPETGLVLHAADGRRQQIAASQHDTPHVIEFDGRTVVFSMTSRSGAGVRFYTWDADTGGEPVRINRERQDPDHYRSSDGTTSVWAEDHRLYGQRTDWPQPRLVAEIQQSPNVGRIGGPSVHGDFVSWWGMDSSYVTDMRSGASVHTSYGYVLRVMGGALVLFKGKDTAAVPLSELSPLPAC